MMKFTEFKEAAKVAFTEMCEEFDSGFALYKNGLDEIEAASSAEEIVKIVADYHQLADDERALFVLYVTVERSPMPHLNTY